MCMVVFFRENEPVAILAADSERGGMDRDEQLPISVRKTTCPSEIVRDLSGCRASGITPHQYQH